MIWPVDRRVRIGRRGAGRHFVQPAAIPSNPNSAAASAIAGTGDPNHATTVDAAATVPQNAPVTLWPSVTAVGTWRLRSRSLCSHVKGADQRSFVAGPIGPVFGPAPRSPQRPS